MSFSTLQRVQRLASIVRLAGIVSVAAPVTSAFAVPDPQSGGGGTGAPPVVVAEKPPAPKPIEVTLKADINLTTQHMTVSSGGKVLHSWPISSGRAGYETPRGTFRPQWAAKLHFSKKYDNAPMPHAVFFNGGIATHATTSTSLLGRPASHGCIRLPATAAATFYALVHRHGYAATRIVVHGTPKASGDEVASRRKRDDGRERVAVRSAPRVTGSYAQSASGYGYAPTYGYGYGVPRQQIYVVRRSPYDPGHGQLRYTPQGYVRY